MRVPKKNCDPRKKSQTPRVAGNLQFSGLVVEVFFDSAAMEHTGNKGGKND
jgi:hypothetical protein